MRKLGYGTWATGAGAGREPKDGCLWGSECEHDVECGSGGWCGACGLRGLVDVLVRVLVMVVREGVGVVKRSNLCGCLRVWGGAFALAVSYQGALRNPRVSNDGGF